MLLLAGLISACNDDDNAGPVDNAPRPSEQTTKVIDPTQGGAEVGSARLTRTDDGVIALFESTAAIPGHTYTLWWVVWNDPAKCQNYPQPCDDADFGIADQVKVEVMFASGGIALADGSIAMSGHLSENDISGSINGLFELPNFGGLNDAETAEVHLVLRSHGPQIPGQTGAQISTYGGGCQVELPPFAAVPMAVGECADIQFAVFQ